jgi:protein SSD1
MSWLLTTAHSPVSEAPQGFVDNPEKYANRLFVVAIKRWPITSLHPFGTLIEELGDIGDIEAETSAILKDCNFSTEDFGDAVVKCLPPMPWSIPEREIETRRDFRSFRIFTIDPETAKDLDDAVHVRELDDGTGNLEVGVHIADVSYFVKPNTALDREARKRATTVYLVQRAYPMLPATLSEQLCSLTPGEDKLAFSVVFTLTPSGKILDTWYGKSVIQCVARCPAVLLPTRTVRAQVVRQACLQPCTRGHRGTAPAGSRPALRREPARRGREGH